MVFTVLVVDDSTFYRRRVREILDDDRELEVIGEARNGQCFRRLRTMVHKRP